MVDKDVMEWFISWSPDPYMTLPSDNFHRFSHFVLSEIEKWKLESEKWPKERRWTSIWLFLQDLAGGSGIGCSLEKGGRHSGDWRGHIPVSRPENGVSKNSQMLHVIKDKEEHHAKVQQRGESSMVGSADPTLDLPPAQIFMNDYSQGFIKCGIKFGRK